MATNASPTSARVLADPPVPPLEEASALTCIQPGGGVCFALETAWGGVRRAWLRAARPSYVRRMAERRQGSCEACPHDIVDARDLKQLRNACGYFFRAEDDPFRWREKIPLARFGLAEVVVASLVCVAVLIPVAGIAFARGFWPLWILAGSIAFLWFEMIWFFRDPVRVIPEDPDALLSPSDGVVTHIDEVDASGFPGGRAARISIYLSPWDVHLNRVPRHARVVSVRYFRGAFVTASREDCVVRNEQLWTDLVEPNGRLLRVKQISGALARRLVCALKVGEEVRAGNRFGMIKYGSRTDVLIPVGENVERVAKVGDRLLAGTSILLRFGSR